MQNPTFSFFILLLMFFALSPPLLAQQGGGEGGGVSGKIVDAESGEPVPFAQVALYEEGEEVPVTGATTADDGGFQLQVEQGVYELGVVFVGFEEKRVENIRIRNRNKNIGEIKLSKEARELEQVVVEAEAIETEARSIEMGIEGMQINPDQTLANTGGTLLDILRNTPSVSVGEDGSISLRGSGGTNILINGRNSALASDLEQIPASAIESIEVVNNPNAKYDAQAAGGIINIKLKQGEQMGTNGSAEVTLGTRWRLNSSLRMNHRTERYNIYGGYSFRRWPRAGSSTTRREIYESNELLEQFGDTERQDTEHTFNYGGDYYFGKNILRYEGALNMEEESDIEQNSSRLSRLASDELLLQYFRENHETEDNLTLDNALIYERTFDQEDQEFRAIVSHSYRDQLEEQNIDAYTGVSSPASETPDGKQRALTDELRQTAVAQADYVHPVYEGKLEAGYKTIFRSFDNDYRYEVMDQATGNWQNQDSVSNRFIYTDQVHALYGIYSRSINNLEFALGSRLEQTFVKSELYSADSSSKQQYLNLFPSLQLQYTLSEQHALKFTYSRRIDRPNAWRLNPFPDVSDSLNVRRGNPSLQPELIHSFEAGHLLSLEKVNLATNLFYRRVNGQLDYIVRVIDGISYRQPENLNTATTYGFEIINTTDLYSWWSFNASYSLFRSVVDGTNLGPDFNNTGLSWYAKLTTEFQLPQEVGLQLTGNYTAPEIEAQGRDLARYYVDASLRRTFFKDQASVSVTLRDVFNTRRFAGENYTSEFFQTFERQRESRILLLNLRYSF